MFGFQRSFTDLFVKIIFLILTLYYIYRWIGKKSKLPPGPLGLPFVGCLPFLGAKPYKTLAKMKEKYGTIIGLKFGPYYTVVLNEYEIAKEVLNHPAALDRSTVVFQGLLAGFACQSGEEWQEQRKFCLQAMRELGFGRGAWETQNEESTRDFIEELASFAKQPVEITNMLKTVIANNVISLIWGRRLSPKTEAEELKYVEDFQNIFDHYGPSVIGSIIPGFRKFCEHFRLLGYDKAKEIILNFNKLSTKELEKHRRDASYKDENLLGNMVAIYAAGVDTVVSSLVWLFRLMAKHPEIQRKVQDELDEVIGSDGVVNYESRHMIPYTVAVIHEAQRFSTIGPITATRSAAYDFEVRGYTIPKGTMICANLWAIHYDANTFPNPETFQPERFLPSDEKGKDIPKTLAFSVGKRNCPGETMAWMVMLSFFTSVMQKFTISPLPGDKVNLEVTTGLVEHLKPQLLCFRERV